MIRNTKCSLLKKVLECSKMLGENYLDDATCRIIILVLCRDPLVAPSVLRKESKLVESHFRQRERKFTKSLANKSPYSASMIFSYDQEASRCLELTKVL